MSGQDADDAAVTAGSHPFPASRWRCSNGDATQPNARWQNEASRQENQQPAPPPASNKRTSQATALTTLLVSGSPSALRSHRPQRPMRRCNPTAMHEAARSCWDVLTNAIICRKAERYWTPNLTMEIAPLPIAQFKRLYLSRLHENISRCCLDVVRLSQFTKDLTSQLFHICDT